MPRPWGDLLCPTCGVPVQVDEHGWLWCPLHLEARELLDCLRVALASAPATEPATQQGRRLVERLDAVLSPRPGG